MNGFGKFVLGCWLAFVIVNLTGCASDEQTALDARAQAAQQSDSHANMSHGWGNE